MMRNRGGLLAMALLIVSVFVAPMLFASTAAADGRPAIWEEERRPNYVMAADSLNLEDSKPGYSSEYIFGMTKGIMRSTLTPALKPVMLLLTVPLDIVFLPFAAIGGFF